MSYYGAADPKMKKYPSIIDYLEAHHKKLFEVINNLAMLGSLKPRKGGAITFLIPDAKELERIGKVVHSANPEEATNIISAHTLPVYLPDAAAFEKYKEDIPNQLGKRLVVKGVSKSGEVEVDNGKLTLDKAFVPFEHVSGRPRGNMAVWLLKGSLNLDTPKASYKFAKEATGKKGAKRGGANEASSKELQELRTRLLLSKVQYVREGPNQGKACEACPLRCATNRLVAGFMKDPAAYKDELIAAQCLHSGEPTIDFFMLFANPHVFASDRVLRAYHSIPEGSEALVRGSVAKLCELKEDDGSGALLLTEAGRREYSAVICKLVRDLIDKSNVSTIATRVKRLYEAADKRNRLVDPTNEMVLLKDQAIWPTGLTRAFSTHEGLHELLDEAAFKIYKHLRVMTIEQNSVGKDASDPLRRAFRAKAYDELFRCMESCYGAELSNPSRCHFCKQETFDMLASDLALPAFFTAFAKSCMLRCHCELEVVGAGKRRKTKKAKKSKAKRGGADDDSDSSSSSSSEDESDNEVHEERVEFQKLGGSTDPRDDEDLDPVAEMKRMAESLSVAQRAKLREELKE